MLWLKLCPIYHILITSPRLVGNFNLLEVDWSVFYPILAGRCSRAVTDLATMYDLFQVNSVAITTSET